MHAVRAGSRATVDDHHPRRLQRGATRFARDRNQPLESLRRSGVSNSEQHVHPIERMHADAAPLLQRLRVAIHDRQLHSLQHADRARLESVLVVGVHRADRHLAAVVFLNRFDRAEGSVLAGDARRRGSSMRPGRAGNEHRRRSRATNQERRPAKYHSASNG